MLQILIKCRRILCEHVGLNFNFEEEIQDSITSCSDATALYGISYKNLEPVWVYKVLLFHDHTSTGGFERAVFRK